MTNQGVEHVAWVQKGLSELEGCQEELVGLITAVTEVPAPSHQEQERGKLIAGLMREFRFPLVQVDPVGDVIGFFPGRDPSRVIVSMAHMDTVFPMETSLAVKREGNILAAPGVSDNSTSVAQMLLLGRIFARNLPLPHPVILIANVGEEGLGDLKGSRYFCAHVADYDFDGFRLGPSKMVFLNMDGGLDQLVNAGIGSRRLKVTYTGEGGHSWAAFGKSSAIHGLGTAIAGIAKIRVPQNPRTTYNVGVISGGISVNSIAAEADMLIDMRSVSDEALFQVEKDVRAAMDAAAAETNTSYEAEVVGDRPTGMLSPDAPLVRGLMELGKEHGVELRLSVSSTDSNIPLAMRWPSVTMGFKKSENGHRVTEYLYIDSLVPGVKFALCCYEGLLYDRF
jgi:acetylornithine deacetylase/succinyl-diaminopimelate desuccinylase-like protein